MKLVFALLILIGSGIAADGVYGLVSGIEQARRRVELQTAAIVEGQSRPSDEYGKWLYDSIVSTPDDMAMTMKVVATGQIIVGISISVMASVFMLRSSRHQKRNREETRRTLN